MILDLKEQGLRKLDALVGTKVSIRKVSVETNLIDDKSITVQSLSKLIDILLTWKRQRDSLRGTSLSINQREYHNESTAESPKVLAPDRHLSGLCLAGVVDLGRGLEAVDLVLTSEGRISELG